MSEYVKDKNPRSKNRIHVVHRLDRDTSGVLLFSKSEELKNLLQEAWEKVEKKYYTVVTGKLSKKESIVSSYLMENKAMFVYSTKKKGEGKFSETKYRVLAESNKFSLLEIQLLTGRKNQIRVHMQDIGHSVLGDRKYGGAEFRRLMLHSHSLRFPNPNSEEDILIQSPIPKEVLALFPNFVSETKPPDGF